MGGRPPLPGPLDRRPRARSRPAARAPSPAAPAATGRAGCRHDQQRPLDPPLERRTRSAAQAWTVLPDPMSSANSSASRSSSARIPSISLGKSALGSIRAAGPSARAKLGVRRSREASRFQSDTASHPSAPDYRKGWPAASRDCSSSKDLKGPALQPSTDGS